MNSKIIKQVVGIDVAQKELVVTLGRMYDDWTPDLYSHKVFSNTAKGFTALLSWVNKQVSALPATRFVMEATGVYHESLAYFLDDQGCEVSIVLPNKLSNYSRTLDVKTVTDKTASQAIALFGLERKLDKWKRPSKIFRSMRQLTREREQVIQMRTMAKNQLHAERSEAFPNSSSLARIKQQITLLDKQEREIKTELQSICRQDKKVEHTVELLCTIPGIGPLTAATVLAETNGFNLIGNKRQLVSYAGLDVKEKQSGTSVKGKPRISKKGNKYLRKAMHCPSLSAIRSQQRFRDVFERLVAKHGIKMKGIVAIQRKLLELTYILYKNQTPYNENHYKKLESSIAAP